MNINIRKLFLSISILAAVITFTGCHEHTFLPATCTTPATCSECGEVEGEALGHSYMAATCTEPQTCVRCGSTIGTALGHSREDATCENPQICKTCGEEFGEPLGHKFEGGSCTEDSVCSVCQKVLKAPGHDYEDATCDRPKHCKNCDEEVGEALDHSIKGGVCVNCGKSFGSLDVIKKICGLKSGVETNLQSCVVNIDDDHNPYDLTYDYGDEYNMFVGICDWSLVFDADYYMKTFPMLATLYHNDKDLLLEHFQTVGIHEGRQGCKDFNVCAYYYNCDLPVYNAFKKDYEGYYFYYMLNYDKEKDVNTTTNNDHKIKQQLRIVLTAQQRAELDGINAYREEVNSEKVIFDSELAAFANYRSYLNVSENWDAHDWTINHNEETTDFIENKLKADSTWRYGENNVTTHISSAKNHRAKCHTLSYYKSPKHYDCMVSTKYKYVGTSHDYVGINNKTNTYKNSSKYQGAQFDIYLNSLSNVYNN